VKKRGYASLLLHSCYALSDPGLKKQLARGLFYRHLTDLIVNKVS
jgi:hypothetical protein